MDSIPVQSKPSEEPAESPHSVGPLRPPRGIGRTEIGLHFLLFLLIAFVIGPAFVGGVAVILLGLPVGTVTPEFLLFIEAGNFAILLGLTAAISLLEERPFGDYGLPLKEAFARKFWIGILLGLLEVTLVVGLIFISGGYSFGNLELHREEIFRSGLLHLVLFLLVGLYEELLFRGYLQVRLSKWVGFWPAAILLSVGFGVEHLHNQGEGLVGALSVALVGLLFAFTLRRTGSLWYAVGLHASFDWGETFLFSVPNSGIVVQGHLSNAVLHGPKWLTGASVGPEGSVFCFLTMGLQFLVVMWLFPKRAAQQTAELAAVTK